MNPEKDRALTELRRRNPFWVCFIVFLMLAGDYGLRLVNLLNQRDQLNQNLVLQQQNVGVLQKAGEMETRVEALSLDLIQISKTNAVASQIVREFNMVYTPADTNAVSAPAPRPQPK